MTRPSSLLPIIMAAIGIAVFSTMDAMMKRASIAVGAYEAMLLRSAFGAGLMWPVWRLRGGRVPRGALLRLHILRGGVAVCMATTFFWGLVRTPMATGIALSFIAPLLALLLAALVLGETVGPKAVRATLLGFGGVVVICLGRASDGAMARGSALAGMGAILLSALFYAWNLILQRQQAQLASPEEVALSQFVVSALILLPAAPWLWVAPGHAALVDIGMAAVLAMVSLMLLAWAYARAEAQYLVPIEYSAFIWSALMGWLWFAEKLTWPTLVGGGLIALACWLGARAAPQQGAPVHIEQTAL